MTCQFKKHVYTTCYIAEGHLKYGTGHINALTTKWLVACSRQLLWQVILVLYVTIRETAGLVHPMILQIAWTSADSSHWTSDSEHLWGSHLLVLLYHQPLTGILNSHVSGRSLVTSKHYTYSVNLGSTAIKNGCVIVWKAVLTGEVHRSQIKWALHDAKQ